MPVQLRDYQSDLVSKISDAYRSGSRAPCVQAPTGAGKGSVIAHLAGRAASKGGQVLLIAHRREILLDLEKRVLAEGVEVGRIMSGEPENPAAPVQVAGVQTLVRRLDRIRQPSLIIQDECHHAVAATWLAARNAWPAARVLGFTATPCRVDGRGLGEVFDALIPGPSVRWLTEQGYLAPARVFAPSVPDLAGVRIRGGDYAQEDLERALAKSSIIGDAVQAYQNHPSGGPEVAFCASIAHATATAAAFSTAGIPAAVLSGSTKPELRDQLLRDLAAGEIKVLATCSTLDEGTDIGCLAGVIMLRPTASLSRYLQQAGRGLRTAEGKTHAVIRDHAGNAIRHGLPIEDREFSLSGSKPRSARDQATDGTALSVRQCPSCYGVHEPAPACPYCGHAHVADTRVSVERAGELRLLDEQEARRLAEERSRLLRDQERGEKTLQDWLQLAAERGYDRRWAHMRHKLRQRRRAA